MLRVPAADHAQLAAIGSLVAVVPLSWGVATYGHADGSKGAINDGSAGGSRDLQRLIRFIERRRTQLLEASEAFHRRAVDATILLSKLWVAVMNLRLRTSDGPYAGQLHVRSLHGARPAFSAGAARMKPSRTCSRGRSQASPSGACAA